MKTQKHSIRALISCAFLMLLSVSALAQQKIKASDIMEALKKGDEITYKDVTVTGVLDFTFMDEKKPDLPTRRRWWRDGGDNEVKEMITSKISFVNVTFEDDVLAYFHDKRSEYTFVASFERDVTFENCKFERNAMFKYSVFERSAVFAGSSFNEETTFKYAEFEDRADFSKTFFDEDAIFKYSKFRDGANFNSAKFDRSLDMKYTQVRGDLDIKDLDVRWDIITKYAEVNGRSFTRYLMDN